MTSRVSREPEAEDLLLRSLVYIYTPDIESSKPSSVTYLTIHLHLPDYEHAPACEYGAECVSFYR